MSADVIKLKEGDIVTLKKKHPCAPGAYDFRIVRTGSDIRIDCLSCGHTVTLPRIVLEKSIRLVNGQKKA